jgi:hypothetical protein
MAFQDCLSRASSAGHKMQGMHGLPGLLRGQGMQGSAVQGMQQLPGFGNVISLQGAGHAG